MFLKDLSSGNVGDWLWDRKIEDGDLASWPGET